LTVRERDALDSVLRESSLETTAEGILRHAGIAIAGRERAKFVFTRYLSEALESIASWGSHLGLSRDDVAYATLSDLRVAAAPSSSVAALRRRIERRRRRAAELRGVRVGHLIRDPAELYVCPDHPTRPTFITTRKVVAGPVLLHHRLTTIPDIRGRIVCIESADPGFDWIFARSIAGLITGFGGGNSHRAIRCIELDVPAALGVGARALGELARSTSVELRCDAGIVRSMWLGELA
jgi:hypothetical protein